MKGLILLLFPALVSAQTVRAVHDGDSYKIEGLVTEWVRIEGVDCPEILWPGHITASQPMGEAVGDSVRELIKGRKVEMKTYGKDIYGRTLAQITIDGRDLAEIILERGWGVYIRNDLDKFTRRKYQRLRDYARRNKLGIWADPGMVTPAEWRRTHRPPA